MAKLSDDHSLSNRRIAFGQPPSRGPFSQRWHVSGWQRYHSHLQTMVSASTHNLPTSGTHPKRTATFKNNTLCSKYLNNTRFPFAASAKSSALRPNSCSQAMSDQISLPDMMAPVSSTRRPMRRGLGRRVSCLEHCLQGVVSALEKTGRPQLGSEEVQWDRRLGKTS